MMKKSDFVSVVICKYWFGINNSNVKEWDAKKKKTFLSGMHRTWNTLFPSNKIGPLVIHRKITTWSPEEAQQWYADYLSGKEVDDGSIKNRWEILDFSKNDFD